MVAQALVETTTIMAEEGDKNKCPRCSGKVFEAEKMMSNKGVFHKKCFTCLDCHRALDASLVTDGFEVSLFSYLVAPKYLGINQKRILDMFFQDGQIFCPNCYTKKYGPTAKVTDEADAIKGQEALRNAKPSDPSVKVIKLIR